jgi:dTDP-4-amino-4,6-dideoxygalactose transaminase
MVPFQRPCPPPAAAIMEHYARSESARYFTHRGPCAVELGTRLGGVPVANGTTGLMIALAALAGQRRFVAMPSFTCPAVACAVRWAGLEPLWVDIESEGWQLDPVALSAALDARGEDVAAVIATLTFGAAPPAAIAAGWRRACAAHGIPLIVDAAAALGAAPADGGPALDAIGAVTLFSLGVTKPGGAAEGAVLAARDGELADRLRVLASFGMDGDNVVAGPVGLNGRLSELNAAAALAALDALDASLARRRSVATALLEALAGVPLSLAAGAPTSTFPALHVALPDHAARERARAAAATLGVETRTHWDPPLHHHPTFAHHPAGGPMAVTEELAPRCLALPVLEDLRADEIALVARALAPDTA